MVNERASRRMQTPRYCGIMRIPWINKVTYLPITSEALGCEPLGAGEINIVYMAAD